MAGLKKDVNAVLRRLQSREYGCTVTAMRTGHWRVSKPGHRAISVTASPSDHRALQNLKADVKRHLGIVL